MGAQETQKAKKDLNEEFEEFDEDEGEKNVILRRLVNKGELTEQIQISKNIVIQQQNFPEFVRKKNEQESEQFKLS